jgi:hypothetical protein
MVSIICASAVPPTVNELPMTVACKVRDRVTEGFASTSSTVTELIVAIGAAALAAAPSALPARLHGE